MAGILKNKTHIVFLDASVWKLISNFSSPWIQAFEATLKSPFQPYPIFDTPIWLWPIWPLENLVFTTEHPERERIWVKTLHLTGVEYINGSFVKKRGIILILPLWLRQQKYYLPICGLNFFRGETLKIIMSFFDHGSLEKIFGVILRYLASSFCEPPARGWCRAYYDHSPLYVYEIVPESVFINQHFLGGWAYPEM